MAQNFIIRTVIGLLTISSTFALLCPDGWRHFSGSCYSHSNDPDTWSGAAYYCKQKGGRLVEINSHAENQFLHSYFLKGDGRDHWINLHRCGGSLWCHLSMESAKFTNWDKTQPDNREGVYEACAEMWFTGKWHDAPCEEHQPFMCEKDSNNSDQAPKVLCHYLKNQGHCSDVFIGLTFCKGTCTADNKNKIAMRKL